MIIAGAISSSSSDIAQISPSDLLAGKFLHHLECSVLQDSHCLKGWVSAEKKNKESYPRKTEGELFRFIEVFELRRRPRLLGVPQKIVKLILGHLTRIQ